VNPKVVPLPRPKLLHPVGGNSEQPKEFRFSVTWETLLDQQTIPMDLPQPLDLPQPVVTTPSRALQVVDPPARRLPGDEAAWEMVVPKMVRK
jgi:hypothetical protein